MNIIEIIDSVWRISSNAKGPTVAIVGGTHGNERTGIELVKRLLADCLSGRFILTRGELLLALGNPRAIEKHQRGSEAGADLNRCFTANSLGSKGARYEEQRARELAEIFARVHLGIDIHATNTPSEPFLVSQRFPDSQIEQLCRCFKAGIVLTDPDWVFAGEPTTLDELFAKQGGVGLCYETGHASDTSRIDEVEQEIRQMLVMAGLLKNEAQIHVAQTRQSIYQLSQAITLTGDGFIYAEGVGARNFQVVKSGELIGHHGTRALVAQHAGFIVFPKLPSLWQTGKPVGYLARRIS